MFFDLYSKISGHNCLFKKDKNVIIVKEGGIIMEEIKDRIRKIRKFNNLTLEEFANRIMCSVRTVQRYEKRRGIARCI